MWQGANAKTKRSSPISDSFRYSEPWSCSRGIWGRSQHYEPPGKRSWSCNWSFGVCHSPLGGKLLIILHHYYYSICNVVLYTNLQYQDAHMDMYEDYEGNPYSHASPFARILEASPPICTKLVQIGIRSTTYHQRVEQAKRWIDVNGENAPSHVAELLFHSF